MSFVDPYRQQPSHESLCAKNPSPDVPCTAYANFLLFSKRLKKTFKSDTFLCLHLSPSTLHHLPLSLLVSFRAGLSVQIFS